MSSSLKPVLCDQSVHHPSDLASTGIAAELEELVGLTATPAEVCKALQELGFVRKKVHKRAAEAREPEVEKFKRLCSDMGLRGNQVISIDEVGTVRLKCSLSRT